jgi:hypothetical protein
MHPPQTTALHANDGTPRRRAWGRGAGRARRARCLAPRPAPIDSPAPSLLLGVHCPRHLSPPAPPARRGRRARPLPFWRRRPCAAERTPPPPLCLAPSEAPFLRPPPARRRRARPAHGRARRRLPQRREARGRRAERPRRAPCGVPAGPWPALAVPAPPALQKTTPPLPQQHCAALSGPRKRRPRPPPLPRPGRGGRPPRPAGRRAGPCWLRRRAGLQGQPLHVKSTIPT